MSIDNDWIISIDDHIIEPPELWTSRLPKKYQDIGPRVISTEEGDRWAYEDVRVGVSGLVTSAGVGPASYNPMPVRYADIRPSCYDPVERLKAMDDDHVLGSMVFPNFPRFCGQIFWEAKDKDLALLGVQAYNDFILDEWCAVDRNRMIGAIILPFWDPTLMVKEIERCLEKGARSVIFSEHPPSLGLPSIHDPGRYWDPVWEIVSEAKMPVSIHIGSSSTVPNTGKDSPSLLTSVLIRWATATTCADWMFCDALRRFPDLRISLSEGGIGWLPPMIEAASYAVDHYLYNDLFKLDVDGFVQFNKRTEKVQSWPHGEMRPIEVFRRNIRGCFVGGLAGYADYTRSVIERYGADIFLVEADFPHHDSSYPNTAKTITEIIDTFSEEDQARLRRGNAMEWYNIDMSN